MPRIKAEWAVFKRPNGELVAKPSADVVLKRYVMWNPITKVAMFKELMEPPVVLGTFDDIQDAIKKVMKS